MAKDLQFVVSCVDQEIGAGDSYLVENVSDLCNFASEPNISMRVIAQNIRSVNKNFDDLSVFLQRCNLEFDLIVLTECWLETCSNIPQIDDYISFQTSKHLNQNSGVITYIRSNINDVLVYEPYLSDADSLVVKVGNKHVFICIYRSPSFASCTKFFESLDNLLTKFKNFPNIYIIGDINIDISDGNNDTRSDEYLDLLASHGLLPSHTLHTRGSSCLDHYFVKSKIKVKTVICNSAITDHSSVHLSIPISQDSVRKEVKLTYTKINYEQACHLLSESNWDDYFVIRDPNLATEVLINKITQAMSDATQTYVTPCRKIIKQPWVTPGLLRCMRFRDTLHERHKKILMILIWQSLTNGIETIVLIFYII